MVYDKRRTRSIYGGGVVDHLSNPHVENDDSWICEPSFDYGTCIMPN